MVAPLVGAWIEIYHGLHYCSTRAIVAPLVGAWIEISVATIPDKLISVAPLVGAWIEIFLSSSGLPPICCRSPRGSAD